MTQLLQKTLIASRDAMFFWTTGCSISQQFYGKHTIFVEKEIATLENYITYKVKIEMFRNEIANSN